MFALGWFPCPQPMIATVGRYRASAQRRFAMAGSVAVPHIPSREHGAIAVMRHPNPISCCSLSGIILPVLPGRGMPIPATAIVTLRMERAGWATHSLVLDTAIMTLGGGTG